MRAVVTGPLGEPLTLEERAEPEPGPGELVLRVAARGVCGSDLHLSELGIPGIVLGHEFAEVLDVGPGDSAGFAPGDRVCAFALVACGACPACVDGRPAHCRVGGELIGMQRPGGYAGRVVTAAKDTFRLPDSVGWDGGALVEPLAVAHHALEVTPRDPDGAILVLGG